MIQNSGLVEQEAAQKPELVKQEQKTNVTQRPGLVEEKKSRWSRSLEEKTIKVAISCN